MIREPLIVLLVVWMGACTGDRSRAATEVRDSAGIRIVQNHRPAWDSSSAWRLNSEPAVDFGPADTLYRIGPIVPLNDGRIVVANGIFDREGVWLGSVTLPPRFMPRQVGSDFMLGKWTNDLDVEHVRL